MTCLYNSFIDLFQHLMTLLVNFQVVYKQAIRLCHFFFSCLTHLVAFGATQLLVFQTSRIPLVSSCLLAENHTWCQSTDLLSFVPHSRFQAVSSRISHAVLLNLTHSLVIPSMSNFIIMVHFIINFFVVVKSFSKVPLLSLNLFHFTYLWCAGQLYSKCLWLLLVDLCPSWPLPQSSKELVRDVLLTLVSLLFVLMATMLDQSVIILFFQMATMLNQSVIISYSLKHFP